MECIAGDLKHVKSDGSTNLETQITEAKGRVPVSCKIVDIQILSFVYAWTNNVSGINNSATSLFYIVVIFYSQTQKMN